MFSRSLLRLWRNAPLQVISSDRIEDPSAERLFHHMPIGSKHQSDWIQNPSAWSHDRIEHWVIMQVKLQVGSEPPSAWIQDPISWNTLGDYASKVTSWIRPSECLHSGSECLEP